MVFARAMLLQNFPDDMWSPPDVFVRREAVDIIRQQMLAVREGGAL